MEGGLFLIYSFHKYKFYHKEFGFMWAISLGRVTNVFVNDRIYFYYWLKNFIVYVCMYVHMYACVYIYIYI